MQLCLETLKYSEFRSFFNFDSKILGKRLVQVENPIGFKELLKSSSWKLNYVTRRRKDLWLNWLVLRQENFKL